MKRNVSKFFIVLPFLGLLLSGCGFQKEEHNHQIDQQFIDEDGNLTEPIDIATHSEDRGPDAKFNDGIVLVKTSSDIDVDSLDLDILSVEPLFANSKWKKIILRSGSSIPAVKYLRSTNLFEKVDYDYIMDASSIDIDVSSNPYAEELTYLDSMCIGSAWNCVNNLGGGQQGGGSQDVVIAVIDTGVDYNHIDLANNIWANPGEIPNNGIDDDRNGFIDDIRGWNFVGNNNNPMDDNGHGTHVSGIAAAENNNIGTVGVSFNCKIMPIKAGNYAGSFTNENIIKAITYAYMNGASVINMSFGGSGISLALEEALQNAYNSCVLVAAAGNSGACNEPTCGYCFYRIPIYPASLPYVIGVMSCDARGISLSPFSNYDHAPNHYNSLEYDTYACGENIVSTWPGNKYARLSGTSMSAPIISGIAALLRSAFPDRDAFSTKYLVSQICNTGNVHPATIMNSADLYHSLCNAQRALTVTPTPNIYSLYRSYVIDSKIVNGSNNEDGIADAGETVKIGLELQNRGGKASNITATISLKNESMLENFVNPYVNIIEDTISMDEIGTFSTRNGGLIYSDDKVVDIENAFVVNFTNDSPNNQVYTFNVHVEYYNGLENDGILYQNDADLKVSTLNGVRLSGTIDSDVTFTNNNRYILTDNLNIASTATVVFEEGCEILAYSNNYGVIMADNQIVPTINVYGTLIFNGSLEKPITLKPDEQYLNYGYYINVKMQSARIELNHCNITNCIFKIQYSQSYPFVVNCTFNYCNINCEILGRVQYVRPVGANSTYQDLNNCILDMRRSQLIANEVYNANGCLFLMDNTMTSGNLKLMFLAPQASNNLFVFNDVDKYISDNENSIYISGSRGYGVTGAKFNNNSFIKSFQPTSLNKLNKIHFKEPWGFDDGDITGNVFDSTYLDYESIMVLDNFDDNGVKFCDLNDQVNHDDSVIWPYVKDISIYDSQNNVVNTVGAGQNTVRVTFSKELDISKGFSLYYGSTLPYADYEVYGDFISETVWEGVFQVKANIEGGTQFFKTSGGVDKDDEFKTVFNTGAAFSFDINNSSAYSMNLQAEPTSQGVQLTWIQDDYDTLMGYNIYRSNTKDGNYTKMNPSIIPAGENTYLDDSAEPGKAYWYTFTVVLSDFTESSPAGKVSATMIDTINPTIYHTPVNQGYAGNNLVVSCSASDNIAVVSATLYYRTIGDTEWKTLPMAKNNDRYSATIYGSDVTIDGLEYYIAVSDGTNTITRGNADSPFSIIVKDSSTLNNLGDVDGDGVITTKDALMIIRAINDELILTDDQFQRADLNKDGELSTFEALRILQYINGNVTTLEM